jgi:hypothetical protein
VSRIGACRISSIDIGSHCDLPSASPRQKASCLALSVLREKAGMTGKVAFCGLSRAFRQVGRVMS